MQTRVVFSLCLLAAISLAGAEPVRLQPPLNPALRDSFHPGRGDWKFDNGVLTQTNPTRLSSAVLKEPALSDVRFSVDFLIHPVGDGVRAAALILRATGTLTYLWVHLDSRHRQVILTRSMPQKTWIEIARKSCPGLTDDTWHTVVAEARGTEITITLDGQEVLKAEDDALAAGRVGLGTSQGQVSFRNLKIEGEAIAMTEALREEMPPYRIISHGEAAGPYQAFPDACRLQSGEIMAVFYAGYGHVSLPNEQWPQGGRICTVTSSDEGRTWTEPRVLYDGPEDDRDPHIAQLQDGTLLCSFFSYWKTDEKTRYRTMLVRSSDGGKTWSEAQPVTPEMWAVSAPVRQTPDGTLILGIYASASYGGVVRSTDNGLTWSEPIPIGKDAGLPLDAETDVILLKDGTLYAALRSSKINMHYSTSRDLGLTWSPVQDIGFKGHAPHFTRLSTGEILLTHRVPQTALHVSDDEAQTWQGPHVIDNVGGAYPATVELKDGTVLAIYYEEGAGSAIRVVRLKLTESSIEYPGW